MALPITVMIDPVIIHNYNPDWSAQFEVLAAPIRAVLGPLALSVEHVGSTSVPQLAAKPIIDMVLIISSRFKLPEVIERLAELGYTHHGDQGITGREVLKKKSGVRHHLYVCAVDSPPLHEHLLFRDFLRSHPDRAQEYGELKKGLAAQYGEDRERYTEAKTAFIQSVLHEAFEAGGRLPRTCMNFDVEGHYVAVLLEETMNTVTGSRLYAEVFHLLHATDEKEAHAQAGELLNEEPGELSNDEGEVIQYRFLKIVEVAGIMTAPSQGNLHERYFRDLSAYERYLTALGEHRQSGWYYRP